MIRSLSLLCAVVALGHVVPAHADDYPGMMFILDGSGSMWGPAGNQTKIEAAREVMHELVPSLPQEISVGLTSYGHRRKGDCRDVEILVDIEGRDRKDLLARVDSIQPKGKTPIVGSIRLVAEKLKGREQETTIVLVSDGEETCDEDPCELVRELKASGIQFRLHVVGFDVNPEQRKELECLANAGGGSYLSASDSASLLAALNSVQEEVQEEVQEIKVEKAKAVKKKATSALGKIRVTLPGSATISLASIAFKRPGDDKIVKNAAKPKAETIHPLLAGEYEVLMRFANSNYNPPTEVSLGRVDVVGGEMTELAFGSIGFNLADSLAQLPAAGVSIRDQKTGETFVTVKKIGNAYYLFRPKPVLPGTYEVLVYWEGSVGRTDNNPIPMVLASDVEVKAGVESTVTIDSGIQLEKPADQPVVGWDLLRDGETVIEVRRRWDNQFPLWESFAVSPGTYDLNILLKGMDEALPVGQGLEIRSGELLQFDTGL